MSCSLTSPCDRTSEFASTRSTLSDEDVETGKKVLLHDIRFTQIEQHYADPPQMNQKICLVSFIPSKTAKPDKDGVFGFMKVRGVYATEDEANERAEFIIRNVDSYHHIFHANVGRPFPVTTSDIFCEEVKQIDIRKKATETISEDILSQKKKERQDLEEMKQREKALLEESDRAQRNEPLDDFETYITEQVKRAQLLWTYLETKKKMVQMRESIEKTSASLKEKEEANPDYFTRYKERYYQARKEAGLPSENTDESFLKYLGVDILDVPEAGQSVVSSSA
jgi:hypothetical protein